MFKERETGFEPATLALARRYSTTEPLAHIFFVSFKDKYYYTIKNCSCQHYFLNFLFN